MYPIDIAHEALSALSVRLHRSHPELAVHPVAADFISRSVPALTLPRPVQRLPIMGFFPGSTIGNFDPVSAAGLLASMRLTLGAKASLLVGVDLRESPGVLVPAYDDAQGVTAAFNRNLLVRLNREADADFDVDRFAHRALWNPAESRMEMHLVSLVAQTVHVAGEQIDFRQDETIHTENSYKYTIDSFTALVAGAGWQSIKVWTDPGQLFSEPENLSA